MNSVQSTVLWLIFAMAGTACIAQETSTAFADLPEAPQARIQPTLASESQLARVSSSNDSEYSFAITTVRTPVVKPRRIVDMKFLIVNGLHLGLAILDTEMTQHCIASHRCREGNPLMPSSHAGQLTVDFAFFAYGSGVSYWFRKHNARLWWLPPTGGMAAHTAGIATGILHR